ncbi:hypothetical protein B0A55_09282 [Friedmanniomyces simplex]|uniref:RRM domain-containing protein n=1 Tax=Friedmanniomyces simplex TaxID=329884 RepID=A0A4U0WRD5_9PEZI|nr:hypothetical protein B0A55_09282 [Friedmanniomyces simplex]
MAADSHGHDGPVIASSNRYTDLAPYCGRIYAAEHHKWRDVLPWDFPPAATKDDEEAFLRTYFTDREIYVQGGAPNGYKFLKQVWYCIAMWNVQVKVPRVAEQWIREMGITAADPTMTDFIMAEEAELKTFFSKQEIEKYGEKLLGVAVKHIQYLVSSARRDSGMDQVTGNFVHDGGVAQPVPEPLSTSASHDILGTNSADDARDTTNARDERRTGTLQPASQPNVTRSAQPQKVGLALTDHPASSDQTVSGPVRRPRAGSSVDHTSYMAPPPQSRKRGNSNAKPNNIRNATAHRYEQHQQRSGAIFRSPYQQSPQFNMAAPTIGNDRSFSNTQPYPMQNQMRMPSDFTPNYMQFPSNYPQQLQGPPPPGMYGPGLPQQAGPPGLVFDERNFQPAPSAFRPPPYQQPPPVYYSNSQLKDRTNDRSVNEQFNNGMHAGEDMYGGMRGGKRHVSNASRNSRPRGYSNSGRGKGSRGNRNSFTGPRPQNDFFDGPTWAHQPSVDQGLTQGSDGGYSNRRTSAAGGNWGGNASKPQYQPNENMQPARAFSGPEGPEGFNPTRPVFWAQSSGNTGLPPRQPGHDTFEPGFRRPSDSHNSQVSNQQAPYNARQRAYSTSQPPQDELLHDPAHPMAALYPGRLVTENHIGIDCGHVRKLLIFAMPGEIRPQQVSQLFERCGPVTAVNGYPPSDRVKTDYKGREVRDVWITFRDHLAAMNALKMDGQQLFPGAQLKIRVPREYWEITHERYPGQGHPQQRPRVYGPNRRFSFEPSMPENTPMQAPPAMPEHREPQRGQHASGGSTPVARAPADPKLHKELLSGSTTPTPSGGSSPKKKKQNRGKGKTKPSVLLGDAVADAAKEMEKRADSVRAKKPS